MSSQETYRKSKIGAKHVCKSVIKGFVIEAIVC